MSYSIPETVNYRFGNRVITYMNGVAVDKKTRKITSFGSLKNASILVKLVPTAKSGDPKTVWEDTNKLLPIDLLTDFPNPRGFLVFNITDRRFEVKPIDENFYEDPNLDVCGKIKKLYRNQDKTFKLEFVSHKV